ncbi:retrotransposon protein, putative, ty1-copia subclass [Tanacetum coccineum]|uniref:Retrotransposon protein, putative, ty1-copia subclass n=1 Tax=Tanacetum coccineum TaxID=301880 RepID=A0ABQ5A5U4_9ASTR
MHNMGKTIGELHALLIEYEKGLPKKAGTPQVLAIQDGRIQKSNKKSQNTKGKGKEKGKGKGKDKLVNVSKPKNPKPFAKENPEKDDVCHHYKEGLKGERKLKQGAFYFISVSKNIVLYFNAIPRDGIYEIYMLNLVLNVNSIDNVSSKRAKHNLDSTYMWHCRLAHISKKRIEKPQHDGLLKSTDDETLDQCVSCLSGKMESKPFLHRTERVTDLLGLIHRDVFKNEVENQLGKTIKALRSDRGGEYISQEFKDYLKACRIVQQLTPPCTPQHNGMSERRNHTLLDMVRSMMNLTTLSLYFWDYALESATRILNMVPTKKVDKAPYELWYGKVPNLSYLKFLEKNLISQEASRRAVELEEIQDEDTSPSKDTSEIPADVKEVEEHSLGYLNEPTNYKAALLDSESDKWLDAMNAEMQSIKDNQVWHLVDLPPNGRTV